MYTEKDLIEDFDYLARKCDNFEKTLRELALDEDEFEENLKYSTEYFLMLSACFNSLNKKYSPYFDLIENEICASCREKLKTMLIIFKIFDVEFEFH